MLDNDHHEGTLQEFAEHFMVQVWREGMQVWEDYRDDQVSPFSISFHLYAHTFHQSCDIELLNLTLGRETSARQHKHILAS